MGQGETLDLPYEAQANAVPNRMCGAAALCMVYRSLGLASSQAEVWPRIARRGARGIACSRTHLLARDALDRGLAALVLQARDPLAALRRCQEHGVRVILNHRLNRDVAAGHFTVLVRIEEQHVVLHDPHYGPALRVSHADLLPMWQPKRGASEVVGNVLVAIAKEGAPPGPCPACRMASPLAAPCPCCGEPMGLQPAVALGCVSAVCAGRTWARIYCPSCDASLSDVCDSPGELPGLSRRAARRA